MANRDSMQEVWTRFCERIANEGTYYLNTTGEDVEEHITVYPDNTGSVVHFQWRISAEGVNQFWLLVECDASHFDMGDLTVNMVRNMQSVLSSLEKRGFYPYPTRGVVGDISAAQLEVSDDIQVDFDQFMLVLYDQEPMSVPQTTSVSTLFETHIRLWQRSSTRKNGDALDRLEVLN